MKSRLNKEICKRCWLEEGWNWFGGREVLDRLWDMGEMHCVGERGDIKVDRVPEKCIYRLEQLVMGNQDETL